MGLLERAGRSVEKRPVDCTEEPRYTHGGQREVVISVNKRLGAAASNRLNGYRRLRVIRVPVPLGKKSALRGRLGACNASAFFSARLPSLFLTAEKKIILRSQPWIVKKILPLAFSHNR